MATLEIKNLHVEVKDEEKKAYKKILKGVNLTMHTGEIHAIMGPNGTGKSTLSETIMGNPKYRVTEGQILLNGENVLDMAVDERARKGLFLAMQYPAEVPGVTNAVFTDTVYDDTDIRAKLPILTGIAKIDISVMAQPT